MPIYKAAGFEFIDEAQVLLIYTSGNARFTDFRSPSIMMNDDGRYREYNELVFTSDVRALGDDGTASRAAESMGELHGPDEHYKTAFVVRNDLDFGLARQFNSRRNRNEGSMQVFLDLESALDFIDVKDPALRETCVNTLQTLAAAFEETI